MKAAPALARRAHLPHPAAAGSAVAERHRQAGLQALGKQAWARAVTEFAAATRLAPQDALTWMNLGRAQLGQGDLPAATEAARQAVSAEPANPVARRLLASCLMQQQQALEASRVMDALPADAPRDRDWFFEHGDALYQARRQHEAVTAFFSALSLKMDDPLLHYRLGLCFKDLGMTREATECLRTAALLGNAVMKMLTLSLLVHESRQACAWEQLEDETRRLFDAIEQIDDANGHMLSPFALLATEATPAQQRRIAEKRCRSLTRGVQPLPAPGPRRPGRVRLGYLSCDFHQHATSVLLAEMLERRDRERFEVILYSHSPEDDSAVGRRVRAACDRFVDVNTLGNEAVARLMRDDGIDIAIDLKGHTRNSRFELLAWRPAPVQVAFLGYPATTGSGFIDYMVGDPVVLPLAHAGDFSEHIAQLPHCYQPNDRQRALPPAPSRASLGLPEGKVVLCCFNQTYKISPQMLDLWARILHDAPDTVLWMLAWNPHARANLSRELTARGVAEDRVIWAPKLNLASHIARLRQADLFLDTWPCNAHTTASEALWAGVPVITVPGPTFASRVAASLVHACGLPDLACHDAEHYVELATALARDPSVLQHLKTQLEEQRLALPLFDTERYVQDYEALLMRMFERQQAGLAPTHLLADAGSEMSA